MKIEKPIFIVGAGRSGSTIFHKIYARNKNLAWLSRICDQFPANPQKNKRLMTLIDKPVIGGLYLKKYPPEECYTFWEYHCKGFRTPFRDLTADDITNKVKKSIKYVLENMLTKSRNRLLIKITGWPRIEFIRELFPDTKFIHIVRDGRALVNSLINEEWWWGWRGPENWRWGPLPEQYNKEWISYNRSFIVLAAIQWKILMDRMNEVRKQLNNTNFMEIKYEELCSNKLDIFKNVVNFCDLDWDLNFEKTVNRSDLKNTNFRWQEELTIKQQETLNSVLQSHLSIFNYT